MVMTLVDRLLAICGALAAAVARPIGGRRGLGILIAILLLLVVVPASLIGVSQRPTDLSFDALRRHALPERTSWYRVDGTLIDDPNGHEFVYRLTDPPTSDYLEVIADAPLALGPTTVTGIVSPGASAQSGFLGIIHPDVPPIPRSDDPVWLIVLAGTAAVVLLIGARVGYPSIRPDRRRIVRTSSTGAVLPAPADGVPAGWAGWIRGESVPVSAPRPCVVTVTPGADVAQMTIAEGGLERQVAVRHNGAARRVRIWRVGSGRPALDIRGAGGDVMLVFDDRVVRDRMAAALD
jgi:hypothetical protein